MRIPLRLVIDTNVVLDLFHFNRPGTQALTDMIASGEALCFTCPRTLEELRHVIPRAHFKLDETGAQALFDRYAAHTLVAGDPLDILPLPLCKDSSDQKFLKLAVSVSADCLITRDKALLKLAKRVRKISHLGIMTPEKFLGQIG